MTDFTLNYNGHGIFNAVTGEGRERIEQLCEKGRVYVLKLQQDRSQRNHNWWFAVVNKAWQTLCEHDMNTWPTPKHLRKHLLIKAGHCDFIDVATDNVEEVAQSFKWVDEYAVVVMFPQQNVVRVYRAKSQSKKAQDREEFREVVNRCLDALAMKLGCDPGDLLAGIDVPEWMKDERKAA